jgi:hypothetical protein
MEPRWQVHERTPIWGQNETDALSGMPYLSARKALIDGSWRALSRSSYVSALEATERNRSQQALPVPDGTVMDCSRSATEAWWAAAFQQSGTSASRDLREP